MENNLAGLRYFYQTQTWLLLEPAISSSDLYQPSESADAVFEELIRSTMPKEKHHEPEIGAPDHLGVVSAEAGSHGEPENNDDAAAAAATDGAFSTNDGLADTGDFQAMAGSSDGYHSHPTQPIQIFQQNTTTDPHRPLGCKTLVKLAVLSILVFAYDSGVARLVDVRDAMPFNLGSLWNPRFRRGDVIIEG